MLTCSYMPQSCVCRNLISSRRAGSVLSSSRATPSQSKISLFLTRPILLRSFLVMDEKLIHYTRRGIAKTSQWVATHRSERWTYRFRCIFKDFFQGSDMLHDCSKFSFHSMDTIQLLLQGIKMSNGSSCIAQVERCILDTAIPLVAFHITREMTGSSHRVP
jgi:hypothetical protein